jgi:hypothetical protein
VKRLACSTVKLASSRCTLARVVPMSSLFSRVLARQFVAGNPGQQRKPVISGPDDKPSVDSGNWRPSRNAGLLKPLRDGHARFGDHELSQPERAALGHMLSAADTIETLRSISDPIC